MKYIFVTVNYSGYEHTKTFIQSINDIEIEDEDSIEIIVVNNFSTKEDLEKHETLISQKENVTLVKSEDNLGYFGGMNFGLKEIKDKKDKTILICNNDLTFDNDFIVNHKNIKYDNDIFLIAPNVITKEGRQQNPLLVNKISRWRVFKSDIYTSHYYVGSTLKLISSIVNKRKKGEQKLTNNYGQMVIKQGIGACYIMTENFWDKFNELDNKVFLWGEETVLVHQIEKYRGKTLYVPTLKIIHHESASVGLIASRRKYEIQKESYKVYRQYL